MAECTFSSFFYGTLMHPKILKRVIGNDASHLQIAPAVLFEHTRHKVKYADYPGVVPYRKGQTLFTRELTHEERCVRGTMVTGLTSQDMTCLDYFEGNEYSRCSIEIHPLQPLIDIPAYDVALDDKSLVPADPPPLPPTSELLPAIPAQTYIYNDLENLEADLWSFEDFIKNNAWKWYGDASNDNPDITEVDRRRELGTTSAVEGTIEVLA
ncbi:uncharacterized protein C8R40DRAFT_1048611 [Lentinula edodes]|uniref:uncharacterized protein n=1 Tax=Lentinula edodes TaxID=5353 RepID=UPI001E8E6FDF|nr:uncharacterized protein C8R40DRAFT_1048611 [Lentinula edodes]KAH7873728.1 hypothetical protein C8R40DRAFT_1048611 [Lentinula edodes]